MQLVLVWQQLQDGVFTNMQTCEVEASYNSRWPWFLAVVPLARRLFRWPAMRWPIAICILPVVMCWPCWPCSAARFCNCWLWADAECSFLSVEWSMQVDTSCHC